MVTNKEKIISAVAYLWILFFLPLAVIPESYYGRFHANQALINFILGAVVLVITKMIGWIPLVGWIVSWVLGIVVTFYTVWGIIFALLGETRPLPIIGLIRIIK